MPTRSITTWIQRTARALRAGDYLIKPDSQERYQVGAMESVQGVFNINRGYTIFRKIEILNSNDEFYTVAKGTDYGLSVYDHIVLDASSVAGKRKSLSTSKGIIFYEEESAMSVSVEEKSETYKRTNGGGLCPGGKGSQGK